VPTTYPGLPGTERCAYVPAGTPTEGLHPQPDDLAWWNIRGRIENLDRLGRFLRHGDFADSEWPWRTPAFIDTPSATWTLAVVDLEHCYVVTEDMGSLRAQVTVQANQLTASFAETFSVCESIPDLPADVLDFLLRNHLFPDFSAYVRFAKRFFPGAERLSATFETDPEGETSGWVALEVRCPGAVDEILDQYNGFMTQTFQAIPAESQSFLRVSLDIL
jgi:hypothetical protein